MIKKYYFIATLFSCISLWANNVKLEAYLDTNLATIGQQVSFHIHLELGSTEKFTWPEIIDSIGGLEIIKKSEIDSFINSENKTVHQSFQVTAWDSGYFVIPSFEIGLENATGYTPEQVIRYNIVPIELGQMMDIKPPVAVKIPIWRIVLYTSIALLILGAVLFAIYHFFVKKKEKKLPPPPPIPAHIQALQSLDKLEESPCYTDLELIKKYYTELTQITRIYLSRRYKISALEMTSTQIIKAVKPVGISSEQILTIQQMLQLSDMIKFAKGSATLEENKRYFKQLREFVLSTQEMTNAEL